MGYPSKNWNRLMIMMAAETSIIKGILLPLALNSDDNTYICGILTLIKDHLRTAASS